ncbi:centrosomal protein of 78 kDa isoform X2 [Callorhinchus milii]|nr:centrosomal protein of 78 kDa isoform X2 [Callorhinchus milii]|eukprot:gi/632973347/ref/XP_007903110.1/ PREDICTED: centrosomal protein of 78 kDa isoform X1 [Callorhinchus milii]
MEARMLVLFKKQIHAVMKAMGILEQCFRIEIADKPQVLYKMIETIKLRRGGALNFKSHYEYLCALQDTVPLQAVKANLSQGALDINGDRIKLSDWEPILSTISINNHLSFLAVRSYHQPSVGEMGYERHRQYFRKRISAIRSKDLTFRLCKSVRDCLSVSRSLKTLELQGLPLRHRDLMVLSKGLSNSKSLDNLLLAYCPIGDEGLEIICQSVKNSATIKTVNFTGCNLTWRGAEHMANIIKYQTTKRHGEVWAESLRYRHPDLDCMTGLRRITVSCNALIGDDGAIAFADALNDDLWLKALDLQQCGISDKGAKALLDALQSNAALVILDVRKNPLIDPVLAKSIIEKILVKTKEVNSEYKWLSPISSRNPAKQKSRRKAILLGHNLKGKATIRIGARKLTADRRKSSHVHPDAIPEPLPPGAEGYVPWRTAARAHRFRGFSPDMPLHQKEMQAGSHVKVTLESASSSETEESILTRKPPVEMTGGESSESITVKQYKRLKMELEECRLRLEEQKRARTRADAKFMELEIENTRLRNINLSMSETLQTQSVTNTILEDEGVLESIEASFQKFHAFLDLLKDAGLGQLATIAGIDQSDFGLVGRPQFSSTGGKDQKEQDVSTGDVWPLRTQMDRLNSENQVCFKEGASAVIPKCSKNGCVQFANESVDSRFVNLHSSHSSCGDEVAARSSCSNGPGNHSDRTRKQPTSGKNGLPQKQLASHHSGICPTHSVKGQFDAGTDSQEEL